jgi:hypothetical protein
MASYAADKPGHTEAAITGRTADSGGDGFENDGATMFRLVNTDGTPETVTFNAVGSCGQGFDHDVAATVPATTGDVWIGPFPTDRFNDTSGYVQLTYSAATALTVYAVSTGGTVTGVA